MTPFKIGSTVKVLKIFDTNTGLERSAKLEFSGVVLEIVGEFLLIDCGENTHARVNKRWVITC